MSNETDVYNVASDSYVSEVLPCNSDSRQPLPPTVSEDEFHEAWRRGGEGHSKPTAPAYQAVRSPEGEWMANGGRCEPIARLVAIDAMLALGLDPSDFRTRYKLIDAISDRINGTLDSVAGTQSV